MNYKQTSGYITIITIFLFLVLIIINNIDVIYAQTTIPNFNIAAVGDWGCNSDTDKTVNSIKNQKPELILGLGDYSYKSSADCWLDAIQPIYDSNNQNANNMQITIGNHEDSSSEDLNSYINALSLTRQFGQVYSFNFNNVHFLSMATEISYQYQLLSICIYSTGFGCRLLKTKTSIGLLYIFINRCIHLQAVVLLAQESLV